MSSIAASIASGTRCGPAAYSYCSYASAYASDENGPHTKAAVVIQPGKLDRFLAGTKLSARMAILHAHRRMQVGGTLNAECSVVSAFQRRIAAAA